MRSRVLALTTVAAAVAAAPASASTVVNGAPDLSRHRGKPVAMMFFHPL